MPRIVFSAAAEAIEGDPTVKQIVTDPDVLSDLHGLYSDMGCASQLDLDEFEGVQITGGRLRFAFDRPLGRLRITTAFELSRKLDASEQQLLLSQTIHQWKTGIGTGTFRNHHNEVPSLAHVQSIVRTAGEQSASYWSHYVDAFPPVADREVRIEQFDQGCADDDLIADLEQAVAKEDPSAMFVLGHRYERGDGVPQSDLHAFQLYRRSADIGHAVAASFAGTSLLEGKGVTQDAQTAIEYFRIGADGGFAFAMHSLGVCYLDGVGVPQDPSEAFRWFSRGADLGDPTCMTKLGECYEKGIGVEINLRSAIECYENAREGGVDAMEENIDRLKELIASNV